MRIHYPRIQNRPIRFALAGCGRISNSHFEAIIQHKNRAELVAACDVDTGALNEIQNKTGVAGYSQYTDLLAAGGFDCVILTTPSCLHPQQTIQAAQAGFNVMTEKPMAIRWKGGVAMGKACDDASVRLFVVKQNRGNATLQLLKRAITQGRFGRIYSVAVNVFWMRPQDHYDSAKFRGTWEFDGGAFVNHRPAIISTCWISWWGQLKVSWLIPEHRRVISKWKIRV